MTLHSFQELPLTPVMLANQLAHRALATQVHRISHYPYRPLTPGELVSCLKPLWKHAAGPELVRHLESHRDLKAAMWLAETPRRRKAVAA